MEADVGFRPPEDVAQAYRRSFKNSDSSFKVFNLGFGVTTSVNELADLIYELIDELYDVRSR